MEVVDKMSKVNVTEAVTRRMKYLLSNSNVPRTQIYGFSVHDQPPDGVGVQ